MAKKNSSFQNYPRIQDEASKDEGLLDDSKLQQHTYVIPKEDLHQIILRAIEDANRKSSRAILTISEELSEQEVQKKYKEEGKKLFNYFRRSYGDPASSAHEYLHKDYKDVAREQFRNRTLQMQRMNSGWRYQFIAEYLAIASKRFISVSDIGAKEADFNVKVSLTDPSEAPVNIYVSVKNRDNTMGGQDWPKAIQALENMARLDKNKVGPYLCVFGIAMQKGIRYAKRQNETNTLYSVNTEVWKSDYFWPFFSNYSYQEIVHAVLEVLIEASQPDQLEGVIPEELLEAFGECCRKHYLIDSDGVFHDALGLVDFFVGK